jgi:hypothetical protein
VRSPYGPRGVQDLADDVVPSDDVANVDELAQQMGSLTTVSGVQDSADQTVIRLADVDVFDAMANPQVKVEIKMKINMETTDEITPRFIRRRAAVATAFSAGLEEEKEEIKVKLETGLRLAEHRHRSSYRSRRGKQ